MDKRFAVLIDADNVSDKYIKPLLDEISNDGVITYKRIYGDWTRPALSSWKQVLLNYSITPIQQYNYTQGKNSTDSAMIIDAMDILHSGSVDGFAIVSSDSDFTRLAARLRESGMYVVGMGEKKTPNPFIAACNRFVYLENLGQTQQADAPKQDEGEAAVSVKVIRNTIGTIIDEISDDDGWANLSEVGNILLKRYPSFDVRSYGFTKLTPFIKSLGMFELYSVPSEKGNVRVMYVRRKT
ncbi:MAG: NYN domain-containing protein [Oscillospiraceae bacterium]|nr:NYN domain-containing protein [Oscillospiraceae bacterium]